MPGRWPPTSTGCRWHLTACGLRRRCRSGVSTGSLRTRFTRPSIGPAGSREGVGGEVDFAELRTAFWSRVDTSGDGDSCWPWKLSRTDDGYGKWFTPTRCHFGHRWFQAHRLAWLVEYGPIPPGWTIDHRCRVRHCCRPAHLRLRTHEHNASDNGWKRREFCGHGHALTDDNVVMERKGRGWRRRCRTCLQAKLRRRYERLREVVR